MTWSDVRNYVLAALLLLASVPLYRYIIARGQAADAVPPERVVHVETPVIVQAPQPRLLPLLAGERCIGGMVVLVNGSTYTQAVDADGRVAHCEGQYRVMLR